MIIPVSYTHLDVYKRQIASNIHGKNHHADGNFSECVLEFTLMNEKGDVLKCSREENSEKFWATFGAMGLTGIIISAKIKLKNVETAYIRQESINCLLYTSRCV